MQAAVRGDPGQRDLAARPEAAEDGGQRAGRGHGVPASRGDDVPGEQAGLSGRRAAQHPVDQRTGLGRGDAGRG